MPHVTDDFPGRLVAELRWLGLPEPEREYRFAPPRRWRFDLAWPERKMAVEVNGAIFRNGRHSRGSGLLKEYEKLNAAQSMGWRVYQFHTGQIENGEALAFIEKELM